MPPRSWTQLASGSACSSGGSGFGSDRGCGKRLHARTSTRCSSSDDLRVIAAAKASSSVSSACSSPSCTLCVVCITSSNSCASCAEGRGEPEMQHGQRVGGPRVAQQRAARARTARRMTRLSSASIILEFSALIVVLATVDDKSDNGDGTSARPVTVGAALGADALGADALGADALGADALGAAALGADGSSLVDLDVRIRRFMAGEAADWACCLRYSVRAGMRGRATHVGGKAGLRSRTQQAGMAHGRGCSPAASIPQ